jgi:PPK2 family polyphosphate:nucleotide phosphotransferase
MSNSENKFRVPFDGSFKLSKAATGPDDLSLSKKAYKKKLKSLISEIDEYQQMMFAHNHHSVLLIFQAMDAAGKDGTIRAVTRGINPAGCQVKSFKQPSSTELDHDFLWRTNKALPERGLIGIYNRSYYEEVLVVRVHPHILESQRLVNTNIGDDIWQQRFDSINDLEKHLARNGTVVLKFWLNVSKDEQKRRFLSRLDDPKKHWKFSESDIDQRQHWQSYMKAYESMLNATSTSDAPWYAIPADNKPFMRLQVAEVVLQALKSLDMAYPEVDDAEKAKFDEYRQRLTDD